MLWQNSVAFGRVMVARERVGVDDGSGTNVCKVVAILGGVSNVWTIWPALCQEGSGRKLVVVVEERAKVAATSLVGSGAL